MGFPIEPPIDPMLAKLSHEIPKGEGWLYEPKWDGFRAIAFRDRDRVHLASRNRLGLERYFPEVVEAIRNALPARCVVDGEIVVAVEGRLEFEALQMRLHPAESRVVRLSGEIPGFYIAFDLLALDDDLRQLALAERRQSLAQSVEIESGVLITPQTGEYEVAADWFDRFEGAGLDGLVAKPSELVYLSGKRAMVKVKHRRTADCVVGGYRLAKGGGGVGSLLLGLYDGEVLRYVGFTSSFKADERKRLAKFLEPHEGPGAFASESAPDGESRWNAGKDRTWFSLQADLVCEVAFDHLQGNRFRHGTTFQRWRTDKDPADCTYEQIAVPEPVTLDEIKRLARA